MTMLNAIGMTIARERNDRGWKQYELANRAGVSTTLISKVEMYDKNVMISTIDKIARAFDMNVYEFMRKVEENELNG